MSDLPQLSRIVRVPLKRFAKFERALGKALIDRFFSKAMPASGKKIKAYLEEKTRQRGIVFKGKYARGWRAERANLRGTAVRIYNKMPYGIVIEKGRRPGRRPPPSAALLPWVRAKLGLRQKEAKRAAFLIARAIGRRGIKARPIIGTVVVQKRIQQIAFNTSKGKIKEVLP